MNNAISRALMVLSMAALVGTVGCGDDDVTPTDSGPGPSDAGPGMTDAGPGMMDGAVMVDAGPGMTDSGVPPTMQCINATDPAALMRSYADGGAVDPDGGMGSSFRALAGACGLACVTDPDHATCVATCLTTRTGGAVSMACNLCYGVASECSATNCLSECTTAAGPTAPACVACQCGAAACIPNLAACTGIPTTACDPPDGGVAVDAG